MNTQEEIKTTKVEHNTKFKLYQIIIACVILAGLILTSYFIGNSKTYDDTYVYNMFQNKKDSFENLTQTQEMYDNHLSEKETLNNDVSSLQEQLNAITDFEKKQDVLNKEIEDLSNQANSLSEQKKQKEKTLKDIENEISLNE